MIYCVWYPSGGFGHFVNSFLNLYGENFSRPRRNLTFSKDGNSHNVDYVAPSYTKNQQSYTFDFDPTINYSIVIDNGIDDENTNFTKFFPGSTIIKLCYSDFSWPIVAYTMITKAMKSNLSEQLMIDAGWANNEPWAQREKYFLFLRDHASRNSWKPDDLSFNIFVEDLLDYNKTIKAFSSIGVTLSNFESVHQQWQHSNNQYIKPVIDAENFIKGFKTDQPITDIWTQAIVYYQIWCEHKIEVPHNEFANFFSSHRQYQHWLESNL